VIAPLIILMPGIMVPFAFFALSRCAFIFNYLMQSLAEIVVERVLLRLVGGMYKISYPQGRQVPMLIIGETHDYTAVFGGYGENTVHVFDCPAVAVRKTVGLGVPDRSNIF
jgi:hypothetical protein